MVAGPDVHRARGWGWRQSLALQVMSATVSGALLGLAAGGTGNGLPQPVRVVLLLLAGVLAMVVGGLEASGRLLPLPQCDRETPRRWMRDPRAAAAKNGAALGCGLTTRIGYWAYFAIPGGALLLGSPELGAVIGGTYGFARSTAVLLWLAARQYRIARGQAPLDDQTWVLTHWFAARRAGGGWMAALGALLVLIAA